jgi:hypothetical protein
MAAADAHGTSPDGVTDGLDGAFDTLARAYTDAVNALTSAADPRAAFAGVARLGELLRELSEDLSDRRAKLAAEVRMRMIKSAVR